MDDAADAARWRLMRECIFVQEKLMVRTPEEADKRVDQFIKDMEEVSDG